MGALAQPPLPDQKAASSPTLAKIEKVLKNKTKMLKLRKSEERGLAKISWLNSQHTFSFGHYHDPEHVGFRSLKVINEDKVTPGAGFGQHGHENMEIISYVLDGVLAHQDSTGTKGIIKPGEIQRMSAGAGIEHSEMNASEIEPVHFLQIWITPDQMGIKPSYEQVSMPSIVSPAQIDLIAGPNVQEGAVKLHADVSLYRVMLQPGATIDLALNSDRRHAWVQVARGSAFVQNQIKVGAGDGLAISGENLLSFLGADEPAELLIFDLY